MKLKKIFAKLIAILIYFISFLPLYADIDVQKAIIVLEQNFETNIMAENEIKKSLTPYIVTIAKNWEKVSLEKRKKLKGLFSRPGNLDSFACKDSLPLTYTTPHFKIHYSTKGEHFYPYDESPINGIPDIIDICAEAYEKSYQVYIEKMNFKKPLTDEMLKDNGGDEKYDVYVFGSNSGWGGFATIDFPLTIHPNTGAGTSAPFFAINVNYYKWVGKAKIREVVKAVCAHEFFHGIQFGYNFAMPSWFMENCTVWGETIVYDGKKQDVFLWQDDINSNLIRSENKLIDVGNFASPVIVDLLEDGYPDLITGNEKDELIIYFNQAGKLNNGIKMQFLEKTRLKPTFNFLDKDNVLDLVIGQENGKIEFFKGSIQLQQQGAQQIIVIKFEDNVMNWSDMWPSIETGDRYTSPILGDINGDGELELIIGKQDGTLSLYKRIKKEKYAWECISKKYLNIDVGSFSVPVLVDIDKDKDLDLLVSGENSKIYFYRNEGTVFNSNFILVDNNLPIWNECFFISLTDIDYDQDIDLIMGLKNGEIKIFQNKGLEIDSAELDAYQDIKQFLLNRFLYLNKSLTTFDGFFEYGGFIWVKFLSEKLGNDVIKILYESFAEGAYTNLLNFGNTFSLRYGERLGALFKEFTLWTYFTGENYKLDTGFTQTHKDDLQKYPDYHYSRGEEFPNMQFYPTYTHINYPLIKEMNSREIPESLGFKSICFLPEGRQGTLVINFKACSIPESQKTFFNYFGTAGYGIWLIKHLANNKVEVKEVFLYNPSQSAQVLVKDFGTNVLKIDMIVSNLYTEEIEKNFFTYSADILDKLPEVKIKQDIKLDWVTEKKKIGNEEKEMKNGNIKISWFPEGDISEVKEWIILRKKYINIDEINRQNTEIGTQNNIKKELEDFFIGKDDYTGYEGTEKDGIQIDDINIITSVSKEKTEFIDTTTFLDIDMKYLKESYEQKKIDNYYYFYYYAVIPVYTNNFWGTPSINTTRVLGTANNVLDGAINPIDEISPEIKTNVNIELGKCEVNLFSSEQIFVDKVYCQYLEKKVDLELQSVNQENTKFNFSIPMSFLNLQGEYKIKIIAMDKSYNKAEIETSFSYDSYSKLSEKFLIYPNPFLLRKHQVITFIFPNEIEVNKENKIKIYNIVGELVFEIIFKKEQRKIEWNPEKLSSGIYLYYFEGFNKGEKIVFKGKFSIIK